MTANSIDMKHIYEKGLEPVDFIKYTLPLEDNECEELIGLCGRARTPGRGCAEQRKMGR